MSSSLSSSDGPPLIVIQARMGATRLPGKVLRDLGGRPVLHWVVRAAHEAGVTDTVVVATTTRDDDDAVASSAEQAGATVVRGPVDDVLTRYLLVLDQFGDAPVVRLTADCPLLDPAVIRMTVGAFLGGDCDYVSTVTPRSLPVGLDVEVASASSLRRAGNEATGVDRAHVTSYLYRTPGRFRVGGVVFAPSATDLRVTLDTEEDARLLEAVVANLGERARSWRELVAFLRSRPDIAELNANVRHKSLDEG